MHLFSTEWTALWVDVINNDGTYKEVASDWIWPVNIKCKDDEGRVTHCIFLDLYQGTCKHWELHEGSCLDNAAFEFSAPLAHWETLINEQKDPIYSIMRGYIKMEKGNLLSLSRYSKAGKRLLELCPPTASPKAVQEIVKEPAVSEDGSAGRNFKSTGEGIDFESFPMQLFQKAKKLGIWNPADIDFSIDKKHWEDLSAEEMQIMLHLTSLFVAGEESVTSDILPLMNAVARDGYVEEEIYLTSFLWEEAKHTEFFSRFIKEVALSPKDLHTFHSPNYKTIFYEELPKTMEVLYTDHSAEALARASVTYNMIVEGTLAETGYHAYYSMLDRNKIMPGLKEGIGHLKRDESRHIAYGMYLLGRLIKEDTSIQQVIHKRLEELIEPAIGFINEIFEYYGDEVPFGLQRSEFIDYAMNQFNKRIEKLDRIAKGQTINLLSE